METETQGTHLPRFLRYSRRQWMVSVYGGVLFVVLMWLSERYIPHPSTLFPASAVALSLLFLEGLELWPIIFLASLVGGILSGLPLMFIGIQVVSQTSLALLGAWVLRKAKVDPIFRRMRDMLLTIMTLVAVSLIPPTLTSLGNIISAEYLHTVYSTASWGLRYTGTLLCLLIITPFLLRWWAKPRFSRTFLEWVELVIVFGLLAGISFVIFVLGIDSVSAIPTIYFLLLPLFWIALRLRPRFVTLAMLVILLFAFSGIYYNVGLAASANFSAELFQVDELLIVLSMIFYIMVAIEENRRLSTNLMRSHLGMLENALARISSESNAKNDFIAILAHELRNPLAPIMSSIDLLKLKESHDPEELEMLTMMESMMQTVRRLLDDLLDISRISEGKVEIKRERIDLSEVVRRSIIATAHHRQERHQSLSIRTTEEPLCVLGDAVRLEQVFSNLLTNASKYSNSGDQITVSLEKHGNSAQVTVSDNGIGIEPSSLENIFVAFHQVEHGERSKKGLGIGLALVRSFVEMHHGSVVAMSDGIGKGSKFVVLLPLLPPRSSANQSQSTENNEGELDAPAVTLKVLVVDDNDAAAWSIGRLLELRGCRVEYAYDGRKAIDTVFSFKPDVILLDLGLPDMEGTRVAKTVRARGYRGKIIALTGYSGEGIRLRGSEVGIEQYMVKPASLDDLKKAIPEIA